MNATCSKCGTQLEAMWKFCALCGTERARETPEAAHVEAKHELAPVKGGFGGLVFGLIAAPVLMIVGTLLLITGIGALPGIAMIAAGVLAPLIGPVMGMNAVREPCPWCGVEVSGVGIFDRFSCPTCGKHIVKKKHELLKAE